MLHSFGSFTCTVILRIKAIKVCESPVMLWERKLFAAMFTHANISKDTLGQLNPKLLSPPFHARQSNKIFLEIPITRTRMIYNFDKACAINNKTQKAFRSLFGDP